MWNPIFGIKQVIAVLKEQKNSSAYLEAITLLEQALVIVQEEWNK